MSLVDFIINRFIEASISLAVLALIIVVSVFISNRYSNNMSKGPRSHYAVIAYTILVNILIWFYLLLLTIRSEFWFRSASLTPHSIIYLYTACLYSCVLSVYVYIRFRTKTRRIHLLLFSPFIVTIIYVIMHLSQKIGYIKKEYFYLGPDFF